MAPRPPPRPWVALTLSALTALTAGCLDELPEQSQIEGLRMMAIMATPPEVGPGQTVELLPLVVDTEERPLTYRWSVCLMTDMGFDQGGPGGPPGGAPGGGEFAVEDSGNCNQRLDAGDLAVTDLGEGATASWAVPVDFFDDTSVIARAYGLGDELPPELLEPLALFVGINMTVSLDVTAGDVTLSTFRRIKVSLSPTPNTNPSPIAFVIRDKDSEDPLPTEFTAPTDGRCFVGEEEAPLVIAQGQWEVRALNLPDELESYPVVGFSPDPDKPYEVLEAEEIYRISLYGRGGSFTAPSYASDATKDDDRRGLWEFEEPPESATLPIWIVTRDGRGGVTWCHSELSGDPTADDSAAPEQSGPPGFGCGSSPPGAALAWTLTLMAGCLLRRRRRQAQGPRPSG